jgi:hypothetical protein
MHRIVPDDVKGMVADRGWAMFFMMAGSLPLIGGKPAQFGDMLRPKMKECCQAIFQMSGGIVAFCGPGFLIKPGKARIGLVTDRPHPLKGKFLRIAQMANYFDDRPIFVAAAGLSSLLLRYISQQGGEHIRSGAQGFDKFA